MNKKWGQKLAIIGLMLVLVMAGCSSPTSSGSGTETKADSNTENKDKKEVQETIVIKLAHEQKPTHPKGVWADDFAAAVAKRTNGQVKVEVYPSAQLYPNEEAAFQAVTTGIIQMGLGTTGHLSGVIPQLQVFDLPMIFPDMETTFKFEDSEIGQELLKLMETKGIVGLGYVNNVSLNVFSNKPITAIDEFNSKKIRVHSSKVIENSISALGGSPVSIPFGEVYVAMQQGVMDAFLSAKTSTASAKLYEVSKHMTDVDISAIVYPISINKKFFDGLPKDIQDQIRQAAKDAIELNRQKLRDHDTKAIQTLKDNGMEVHSVSAEERQKWFDALQSVHQAQSSFIGQDLIDRVNEFLKANK
jgi:C4-dicarboxylate-binding protein DctP